MSNKHYQYLFLLSFCLFILLLAYTTRIFFLYKYDPQNLFILDLLGIQFQFPLIAYYFFSIGSFLLFSWGCFLIFPRHLSFYPIFVYAISPWFHYLTVSQSFYTYLLFLITLLGLSIIFTKKKLTKTGWVIFITVSIIAIYSSLTFSLMFPVLMGFMIFLKLIDKKILKSLIPIILLVYLSLFAVAATHKEAIQNIYQTQITIFSNPGLQGEINRLQGDSKKMGFSAMTKLVENKYIYFGKYAFMKFLKHFTPSTYFTSQAKLLNFSFTPPIFLGFLLPFLYGLYQTFKKSDLRKYLLIPPVFTIPSFLTQELIDINKLVIIAPAIILITGYGLLRMEAKTNKYFLVLLLSMTIVFIQLTFTISDMETREHLRFHKYYQTEILDNLGTHDIGRQR